MTDRSIPTDPLFSQQWFLYNIGQDILGRPQAAGAPRNDINVTQVWPKYTGKGVLVGAIDDGFDSTNPDLVANSRTDLNYDVQQNKPGSAPVASDDDHGRLFLA